MKNLIILVLSILMFHSLAWSNENLVEEILNNPRTKMDPFYLDTAVQKKPLPFNSIIKNAVIKLNKKEFKKFLDWYFSVISFSVNGLIGDNLKKSNDSIIPFIRLNKKGQRPLEGIIAATGYLNRIEFEKLDLHHIKEAHLRTLSKKFISTPDIIILKEDGVEKQNSENASQEEIGKIRTDSAFYRDKYSLNYVYRRVPNNIILDRRSEVNNYNKLRNPYITYHFGTNTVYFLNPNLKFQLEECYQNVKKIICNEIHGITKKGKNQFIPGLNNKHARLLEEYLSGYLSSALEELKLNLKNVKTVRDVVAVATQFYWKYLSIHPFRNGNGRSGKVLLDRILAEYGIPAPIYEPWEVDVTLLKEDLITLMEDAVVVSKFFHDDLRLFLDNGIHYSMISSHFLGPGHLEAAVGKKVIPKEFMTWVINHSSPNAIKSPKFGIDDALREFIQFEKSNKSSIFTPIKDENISGELKKLKIKLDEDFDKQVKNKTYDFFPFYKKNFENFKIEPNFEPTVDYFLRKKKSNDSLPFAIVQDFKDVFNSSNKSYEYYFLKRILNYCKNSGCNAASFIEPFSNFLKEFLPESENIDFEKFTLRELLLIVNYTKMEMDKNEDPKRRLKKTQALFYPELNKARRNNRRAFEVRVETIKAMKKLGDYNGIVYSGKAIIPGVEKNLKDGDEVCVEGFLSTSTKKDIAENFAVDAKNGVLFKIKSLTGKKIYLFSDFKEEREIVFFPFQRFRIISGLKTTDDGIEMIEMEEIQNIDKECLNFIDGKILKPDYY